MKTCTKCNQEKPFTSFTKKKDTRDGLKTYCKTCVAEYQHNNREARAAQQVEYLSDPAKHLRHRAVVAFNIALGKATKFNDGVKPVIGADEKELMLSFLMAARTLSETTGIKFEVDHITPLAKGGEHRLRNLQCITKADNVAKRDSLDFTDYTQKPSYPRPEHIAACEAVAA